MEFHHLPVLLNECLDGLNIKPGGAYLDCTLGGAGHSSEIFKRLDDNLVCVIFSSVYLLHKLFELVIFCVYSF